MYGQGGLREALTALSDALDLLAAVDLDGEDDRAALDATVEQQRLANRLAAEQVRLIGHADRCGAYRLDAAVTMASWYRTRTRLDHGEAVRRVNAAARLRGLPLLAETFAAGAVTAGHVTAVTDAAVPTRAAAVGGCEQPLVTLASQASPRAVRLAVGRLADLADPDGSDVPPLPECGPDPRRELTTRPLFDGLFETRLVLGQVDHEALLTALDAADTPDPADTPAEQRRSPAQRRADALTAVVDSALNSGALPSVQGNRPQVLLTVDLSTLLGHHSDTTQTGRAPRLRFTGDLDVEQARHLALRAAVTVVLTMGPWRVVNVGRRFRTLPPWLRTLVELVHRHCRGPDCDRPITWTQAHHADRDWTDGADTDLNTTVPLCQPHHDLITVGGWTVRFNPDTGTATWTHPNGTTHTTQAA